MIANCSACGMLYNLKILFTSSLKFLTSLYLSSVSQLKVHCFIKGPHSHGPTFCVLYAPATAMACIAALVASATVCAIASLAFEHLPLCVCVLFLLMFAYVRLLLLTPCSLSHLIEDNTS